MLTVSNVDLYYGAAQALRNVSLEARQGEITCVLGRNGVGKTSLLRAIVGQQAIRKGEIRLGEEALGRSTARLAVALALRSPRRRTREGTSSITRRCGRRR